ncbi:MAG: hypothetical protein P4N60_06890 [Verrucomicrobiae bacterium]|nr:hypothetical protein [Verrucomicrobiae bacterium]
MQVSKFSLVLCVLAMGTALTVRAQDNPAQAKAREALTAKLFEISAQEPVTNPPAAPVKPTMDKPVPAAPAVKPADEPKMSPVADDAKAKAKADKAAKAAAVKAQKEAAKQQKAADEAKAKAEADKAAADAKAQKAAAKKAADQKAAEVAAAKKQVKANLESPKPVAAPQPVAVESAPSLPAANGDTPAQAKAREALAHSLFEESAATPVTPVSPAAPAATPAPMAKPAPVAPVAVAAPAAPAAQTVIAPAPIGMAPPLPISMDKQQKLQELLAKYKADQVTPEEYQKQRAAILAEP